MKKLLFLIPMLLLALSENNIFAVTWMNGFCKVDHKSSCQNRSYYSYSNFTIHGLWPKHKNYCSIEKMNLDRKFLRELDVFMPGASRGFAKYEWKKHGSCFGTDAKTYFITSIKLLEQLNSSKIRDFFVKHKGKYITLEQIRYIFKKEFNAPRKFQLICKKDYVVELRISLKGNPVKEDLDSLIHKGDEFIGKRQCKRGLVE